MVTCTGRLARAFVDMSYFRTQNVSGTLVACNPFWSLAILISLVACIAFSVKANRELVKHVLTCTALTPSIYKTRHPDDTDDPEAVGGNSEDEAEDMGEV